MLSRIAESMFWIGRYVERADDTARLLQTHLRLLVEGAPTAEVDACRDLLVDPLRIASPEPVRHRLLLSLDLISRLALVRILPELGR